MKASDGVLIAIVMTAVWYVFFWAPKGTVTVIEG